MLTRRTGLHHRGREGETRKAAPRRPRTNWRGIKPQPFDLIRAELIGSDTATARGIRVKAHAPVLALCRELLAVGCPPTSPLEAWRGATLALRVAAIGTAACLAVRPSSTGAPVFVRAQTVRAASQVRQKRRGRQRHPDLIEQQDDGAHHQAAIAALDAIAEIEERSR
jgi:hypothetical protein